MSLLVVEQVIRKLLRSGKHPISNPTLAAHELDGDIDVVGQLEKCGLGSRNRDKRPGEWFMGTRGVSGDCAETGRRRWLFLRRAEITPLQFPHQILKARGHVGAPPSHAF